MSSIKKNRLSLTKKRQQNNHESGSTPTILSMFKKQIEKQSVSCDLTDKHNEDSGSESDVVITKVVQSKSLSATVNLKGENEVSSDEKTEMYTENTGQRSSLPGRKNKLKKNRTGASKKTVDDDKMKISNTKTNEGNVNGDLHKEVTSNTVTHDTNLSLENELEDDEMTVKQIEKGRTRSSRLKAKSRSLDNDVLIVEDVVPKLSRKRKLTLKRSKTDSEVYRKKSKTDSEVDRKKSKTDSEVDRKISKTNQEGEIKTLSGESDARSEVNAEEQIKTGNQKYETKMSTDETLIGNELKTESDLNTKQDDKVKRNSHRRRKELKMSTEDGHKETSDSKLTFDKRDTTSDKTSDLDIDINVVHHASSSKTVKMGDDLGTMSKVPGDGRDEGEGDLEEEPVYKVPYYLENFHTILDSVLSDKEYARLFDSSDMEYISSFKNMSEPCQKLFVRIFGRKLSWFPMVRLRYPEISDDIPGIVEELTLAGFLKSGEELTELPVVLKLLAAPDLKALAKSFHLNTANTTKPKLVELLLKKSQQSSIGSLFAGSKTASTFDAMLKRAKGHLGKVTRLKENVRAVFIRLLMLFCLYNTNFDEENGNVGQNQLFQMLMVNIGKVTYPKYTVNKKQPIFKDREAVVRFETALQLEMDLLHLVEKNKWDDALIVYEQARALGVGILKNKQYRKWATNLPEFLRLYTAGSIYIRIANQGVEILQRKKKYTEAVALLEEMLSQKLYCNQYRGHWYERLALNLDAHLKKPAQSLDVIKRGLTDDHVKSGRKLAIYERAKKICEAPKSKFSDRMKEFIHDPVSLPPETTIEGMVISDATSMGMKYQFVMQGDSDSVTFCAVEELVLEHYKHHGYPDGLHAEGSIIANLFTLYFWEILYMDIEDVFQGQYQSCPLDLYTQEFYKHRQNAVDERLDWIRKATDEELLDEIKKIWDEHAGEMSIGMNWEKFTGPKTHLGLVSCMNGAMIAGILERYVKAPRHTRSGFPDLTLWNTETKALKISEVKGPNDRLSYKQILWIDYLLKLGIDAEVCYVKAVGSKKLKPKSGK